MDDPPTMTLRFGVPFRARVTIDARIEQAFGVTLEARESLHQGGWYSLGRLPSGESVGVYPNWREHDGTWREPRHRRYSEILYFHGVAPDGEPLRALVRERLPDLVELHDPPAREPRTLVNVIDVESTCWSGAPPPGEISEIIEIGITVFDSRTLEIGPTRSIVVRPTRSAVSDFCARLTTLTPAQVASGVTFDEAARELRGTFRSRERTWASWGDHDRRMFDRGGRLHALPSPFGPRHQNLKSLFAVACGLDAEVGAAEALRRLGLPLEGTPHRAGDDSRNLARILRELVSRMRAPSITRS
jgi:inhibitor of KinA sporulation pathway (predicted exonuclease)